MQPLRFATIELRSIRIETWHRTSSCDKIATFHQIDSVDTSPWKLEFFYRAATRGHLQIKLPLPFLHRDLTDSETWPPKHEVHYVRFIYKCLLVIAICKSDFNYWMLPKVLDHLYLFSFSQFGLGPRVFTTLLHNMCIYSTA